MKGKILNTEKSRPDKILNSAEIGTLIQALGTGFKPDFKIEDLRYHKIIIMTDADVDGSHIRTLLLTFLYRHMPELVKNGYVYIAQPPLYKIKRGKMELYLKDDSELEDFFINDITENAVLEQKSGSAIKGVDLKNIFLNIIGYDKLLNLISGKNESFYFLLEQATISNLFNIENFENKKKSSQTLDYLLKRLNFKENNWSTTLENEEIIFSKKENKVTETFTIKLSDFNNFNYVNLKKYSELMQENFLSKSLLKLGDQTIEILSPKDLIKKALDQSKKNYSVQRYKGLGEMNPDQLWQTTLDPEYRSILRVDIDDAQRADDVFEELMGDDVEKEKFLYSPMQKKFQILMYNCSFNFKKINGML